MPESDGDLALLLTAAEAAGEIAIRHAGRPLMVTEKPGGAGPVTNADLAVNAVLEDMLRSARPEYGWLSEESADDPARLDAPATFIIDPIDGTRSFIDGSDIWAHSLAIARGGEITAAVVYLPVVSRLYAAARGEGATLNGRALRASSRAALAEAEVLTTRPNLDPRFWKGAPPRFRRSHRPSLAYRLALVAEGRFDAMFTFRPSWEWDIAAGALICTEAGARVTDRRGAPLRFNAAHPQADGVVAGPEGVWGEVMQALDHPPVA
ncbi:inositol monophosphatase family protein [Litorisediminicola beolgyonensis]|uniref:Inositol monophosphatase family protein n=1 Tax=Litorisediminicola beolgyonensis TaxID=1173614 RepID=A0ABW3ZIE5_9RHOB